MIDDDFILETRINLIVMDREDVIARCNDAIEPTFDRTLCIILTYAFECFVVLILPIKIDLVLI